MKRFNLNQKNSLIAFRLIISMLLFFFTAYANKPQMNLLISSQMIYWILALAGIQAASNLIVAWFPERLIRKGWGVGFFLFDLVAVSMAVYWTQGFESDLFLIYFLVIFMTAVARKPAISFVVAALACFLYGFMFLKTHAPAEIFQSSILIRFPLLWVTAFFSSILVQDLETEKDGMVKQMEAHWIRSEKLAALGQLAKSIAQELNNPLTSILGVSQMLLDQRDSAEEDLRIIERNASRCKKIIEELLTFASEGPLDFVDLDVHNPLNDVLELFKDQLRLSQILVLWKMDASAEDRRVWGSLTHLRQVFFNLILNAIEAMPGGGALTILVRRMSAENDRHISVDFVEVSLCDTGSGIVKEILDHLFDPLFSFKPDGAPGFGLQVAKNLIDKHHGKIWIESPGPKCGARVSIHLPSRAEPGAPQEERSHAREKIAAA